MRTTLNTNFITCLGMAVLSQLFACLWRNVEILNLHWTFSSIDHVAGWRTRFGSMCKVCTEAVHSVALWTRVTLGLGMCKVCTEAVHSVTLWTRVSLGLGMCKVCTEAVHSVALWTQVTLGLGMCKVCTEASPFRSTLNITLGLGMCKVCTEAVHSITLWRRVTLGLGMCKVCTEAVHSVALWTRVTLGLGMCKVCTEAVHSVALWTRVTLGLGMCKVCTEAVHSVALWTRVTLGLGMCKVCTEALDMCEVCISCSVSFSAQNVSKNNPRLQMHETARPVYEMHLNTRFPLGSTSEKMRANEGSEGTTTTTTYSFSSFSACISLFEKRKTYRVGSLAKTRCSSMTTHPKYAASEELSRLDAHRIPHLPGGNSKPGQPSGCFWRVKNSWGRPWRWLLQSKSDLQRTFRWYLYIYILSFIERRLIKQITTVRPGYARRPPFLEKWSSGVPSSKLDKSKRTLSRTPTILL